MCSGSRQSVCSGCVLHSCAHSSNGRTGMEFSNSDAAYDVPRIPLPPIKEDLELPDLSEGMHTVVP